MRFIWREREQNVPQRRASANSESAHRRHRRRHCGRTMHSVATSLISKYLYTVSEPFLSNSIRTGLENKAAMSPEGRLHAPLLVTSFSHGSSRCRRASTRSRKTGLLGGMYVPLLRVCAYSPRKLTRLQTLISSISCLAANR